MPSRGNPARRRLQLSEVSQGSPPIGFRRIPGTRRYYNPTTYEEYSTYAVRQYRARLYGVQGDRAREAVRNEARRYRESLFRGRQDIRALYDLKWEAEHGRKPSPTEHRAVNADFNTKYLRLMRLRYEYNKLSIAQQRQRDALSAAQGPIADALRDLGFRRPTDDWPVGMSPTGYTKTVMVPYFQGEIGRQ